MVFRNRGEVAIRRVVPVTALQRLDWHGTPIALGGHVLPHKNRRKRELRYSPTNSGGRCGCSSARNWKSCRRRSVAIRRRY